jgi:hypothetical protein
MKTDEVTISKELWIAMHKFITGRTNLRPHSLPLTSEEQAVFIRSTIYMAEEISRRLDFLETEIDIALTASVEVVAPKKGRK